MIFTRLQNFVPHPCEVCQPTPNWIFPGRDYWRTSRGSRHTTARANKLWLLGLAGGDVFQNGVVAPYSKTLARDSPAPLVAPASWSAPGPPALWPHAKIANRRLIGFSCLPSGKPGSKCLVFIRPSCRVLKVRRIVLIVSYLWKASL